MVFLILAFEAAIVHKVLGNSGYKALTSLVISLCLLSVAFEGFKVKDFLDLEYTVAELNHCLGT